MTKDWLQEGSEAFLVLDRWFVLDLRFIDGDCVVHSTAYVACKLPPWSHVFVPLLDTCFLTFHYLLNHWRFTYRTTNSQES